jgi:CheY-like chemotaxis protein
MRVLVVDDEPQVLDTATQLFEALGCYVATAQSAREALAFLAREPDVALVFSDVRMPEMTGFELADEIRRRRPGLRVVLTSGYHADRARPGVSVMPKPWRLADIEALVSAARSGNLPFS